MTWDEANPEIASGRKFKWLRERRVGSTLLNQIKNFILAEEVDIKLLDQTLKRQVHFSPPLEIEVVSLIMI